MIAPRLVDEDPQSSQIGSTVNHIHLHVSDRLTDALMSFLGSMTGQRALFDPYEFATQTTSTTATQCGSDAASSTAATRTGPASEESAYSRADRPTRNTTASGEALRSDESLLENFESGGTLLEMLHRAPHHLRQKRNKAGAGQRGKHETSCRAFDQFWLHRFVEPVQRTLIDQFREDVTLENPVIRKEFADYWLGQKTQRTCKPVSEQTIATYWQHVCMVIRAYGVTLSPFTVQELKTIRSGGSRSNSEAIVVVNRMCPTSEELDALARHAAAARTVYGSHAPYLIRFLIRFFACFGIRTNDIISTRSHKMGLRKQDLIWSEDCPDCNVNAALGYTLKNPGGWMWVRIHKTETKHVAVMLLPIPLWARGALKFFCELSHHPVRVFPSMDLNAACLAPQTFCADWNAVLQAAGVDRSIRISEGSGEAIAIRKYSYNWWRLAVGREMNDTGLAKDVAAYIMHHSDITKTTADRHYAVVQATVLPVIVALLPKFPKPAADAMPVSLLPE